MMKKLLGLSILLLIALLISFGIKTKTIINMETKSGNQMLLECVKLKDVNGVKHYLKNGANVNYLDSFKCSPLFYAVTTSSVDIVNLLLNNQADVNLLYRDKASILHIAVEYYGRFHFSTDISQILIKAGANVNHKDKYGNTALSHACVSYLSKIDVIKLLIYNGADMNIKNEFGNSAYSSAKENDRLELLSLLDEFSKEAVKYQNK